MQAIWHAVLTRRNILNLEVSWHVLHVKIHPKVLVCVIHVFLIPCLESSV